MRLHEYIKSLFEKYQNISNQSLDELVSLLKLLQHGRAIRVALTPGTIITKVKKKKKKKTNGNKSQTDHRE
jgi:hypothetical protein